jgi:hypothetical protein
MSRWTVCDAQQLSQLLFYLDGQTRDGSESSAWRQYPAFGHRPIFSGTNVDNRQL